MEIMKWRHLYLLYLGVLLGSFVLLSCEIDEEKNLLFQRKDTVKVAGRWQSGSGVDAFTFASDGTFTLKQGGSTSRGTFRYYEITNQSIWAPSKQVATFELRAGGKVYKISVFEDTKDGDLYFKFERNRYVQIS